MAISRTQMGTQLRGNRTMNNMRKYKSGGKLKMVEKGGKQVPFYAADGKGAMKKGGKVKKYQAGNMVSPDEAALLRGNAAMDRISEEGTTNMMEGMGAKDPRSMRPKKRPTDPRSMKPKARPKPMTKKQQRIAGARGAASQYDTGTRDTPASEPVRRQGAKDTAKRQLDSLMGGGAKEALGMMAGGKVKKMKSGGKIRGYGMARGGKACKMR